MSDAQPSMDLTEELLGLIRALNDAEVEYAVCGGLALAIHGFVRATVDIDLLVPKNQIQAVLAAAKPAGFWIPGGRMPFKPNSPHAMEIWRVSKAQGRDLISLDLIEVTSVIESVWDSRTIMEFAGVTCPVVSRKGLIKMKSLAGRKQDLADIERLQSGE